MTDIKNLPIKNLPKNSQKSQFTSNDGFRFGLGFWMAWAIITLFFIPALACIIAVFLPALTRLLFP